MCKRVPEKWGRIFKNNKPVPPPAAPRGGGADEVKASDSAGINRWQELPVSIKGLHAPAPPAFPKKHERSPKSALFDTITLKTPEVRRQTQ